MSAIFIDTSQLTKGAERFKNMSVQLEKGVDDVLTANAIELDEKAKQLAPVDVGFLRGQISANLSQHLRKEISVNTRYAAYIEFGTGAYAVAYVSSLPANWQAFAVQFRGKAGGTFAEMVKHLQEWARRHGMKDFMSAGFLIARSIIIHGVRPHPFLYPAFVQQLPILERELENVLKQIK